VSADDPHVDHRLDDWLDGRLDERGRREVEEHLAACAECRDLRDGLVTARTALRPALADGAPPADLAARIEAVLDREDERLPSADRRPVPLESGAAPRRRQAVPAPPSQAPGSRDRAMGRRRSRLARIVLPLAAGLALAVLGVWWLAGRPSEAANPVEAAFEQYASLADLPALPAGLAVARAAELERRWLRADFDFPARVLDLSAMGIALAGGDATRLAGAPAARALYRGDGILVACWMFRGQEEALPAPAAVRAHDGFDFRVYRRGGTTLVLWREGEVLCALAGTGDPERVVALAFAKAMAPGALGSGRPAES
jgi:anti-sigma factor RsiW